ncbi:MAG: EscU/YscU/HrcU family type III secretion system export apparatus switch protein [Pseudomonadota bacterium]|nr:EscU/YscU/HrcU family type III secretion system export apparatus switch protein [Pseudomonadota bacterium]
MADQEQSREDKKLPASEKRLREAREEGQVARSRDLGHAVLFGLTGLTMVLFAGHLGSSSVELVGRGLRFDRTLSFSSEALADWMGGLGMLALSICLPIGVAGIVAAVVAAAVPGGFAWTGKTLGPKWSKISPLAGLKRIFSRDHLVDSIRLSLLVLGLALIAAAYVWWQGGTFAALLAMAPEHAVRIAPGLVIQGAGWLLLLLIVIATVDVPMQWFRHRTNLKMTFEQARREHKETEGDPHVKAQRRQRQREMSTGRMMARVPEADVVVTNPTHYAVALKYDEAAAGAPRVVAKGADHVAARIREIAIESGVPMLEAPPLARALYSHVEVDAEIPAALYNAVAQVLAYVYQLRAAAGRRAPAAPTDLPVPAELDPQSGMADEGGRS